MLRSRTVPPLEARLQENSLKHMTTRPRLRPPEERVSPLQLAVTTALDDMKAVNVRVPARVRSACADYLARLAARLAVALVETEPGQRTAGGSAVKAVAAEGERLQRAPGPRDHVAALDERGRELSTRELAAWLEGRMREGEDLAFLIGGPDGLASEVLTRSDFTLSLSRLTLPHALARVLLTEQLYRAHSLLTHHPYHRD